MFTPGSRGCGYNIASGRRQWLNHDPIGIRGGINMYRFVRNNPISRIDSSGLFPNLPTFMLDWGFHGGGEADPLTAAVVGAKIWNTICPIRGVFGFGGINGKLGPFKAEGLALVGDNFSTGPYAAGLIGGGVGPVSGAGEFGTDENGFLAFLEQDSAGFGFYSSPTTGEGGVFISNDAGPFFYGGGIDLNPAYLPSPLIVPSLPSVYPPTPIFMPGH
jgi:hypothetical protein